MLLGSQTSVIAKLGVGLGLGNGYIYLTKKSLTCGGVKSLNRLTKHALCARSVLKSLSSLDFGVAYFYGNYSVIQPLYLTKGPACVFWQHRNFR